MFDREARRAIAAQARGMGVEPAALLAVVEVESAGRVSAQVNGRAEPLIRFEGHYFHRLLDGSARARAVRERLASPRAGAIANPRTQADRWKMLERARAIDYAAADASVSWGLGQVMGDNWRALRYGSVAELVAEARSGVAGQVALMVRFIRANGLIGALRNKDWHAFARRYNGPAYARHGYHTKMAAAYRRQVRAGSNAIETEPDRPEGGGRDAIGQGGSRQAAGGSEALGSPENEELGSEGSSSATKPPAWFDVEGARPVLARGARGVAVERLQRALGLPADGLFGPATEGAVRRFQSLKGEKVDGVVGPRTWRLAERRAARAKLRGGLLSPVRWLRVPLGWLLAPFKVIARLLGQGGGGSTPA